MIVVSQNQGSDIFKGVGLKGFEGQNTHLRKTLFSSIFENVTATVKRKCFFLNVMSQCDLQSLVFIVCNPVLEL